MKRLEITLVLYIDEIGQVSTGPISFVYRGCKDATLFKGETQPDDQIVNTEVVKPDLRLSTHAKAEVVLALSKLGFNHDEAEQWSAQLSAKRILDVAHWVRNKNGVGSPKKLAEKLFALG